MSKEYMDRMFQWSESRCPTAAIELAMADAGEASKLSVEVPDDKAPRVQGFRIYGMDSLVKVR